jgi:hypothetical protein
MDTRVDNAINLEYEREGVETPVGRHLCGRDGVPVVDERSKGSHR